MLIHLTLVHYIPRSPVSPEPGKFQLVSVPFSEGDVQVKRLSALIWSKASCNALLKFLKPELYAFTTTSLPNSLDLPSLTLLDVHSWSIDTADPQFRIPQGPL